MNFLILHFTLVRIIAAAFIVQGALIMLAGLIWLANTVWFVYHAVEVPGTIVEIERVADAEDCPADYPVFSFVDVLGVSHKQRTTVGSALYSFEPDEKISVLYDPSAPEHAKIDSFMTVWLGPGLITVFGLMFGSFAGVFYFLATYLTRQRQR